MSHRIIGEGMSIREVKKIENRFWSKVAKSDKANNCWTWQASVDRNGYGKFWLHGKVRGAHRVAYELTYKAISKGLVICHRCDNPPCVNPSHLFASSQLENIKDMVKKGRSIKQKGTRNHNAKLDEQQVKEIRAKYATGKYSYKQLGMEYGVHLDMIGRIVKRKNWKHI